MPTMKDIDALTAELAKQRSALGQTVHAYQNDLEAAKEKHLEAMRTASKTAAAAWEVLLAALKAAPELFTKPRSVVLHNIKLGWQKGKGGLEISDADNTVALIKRHFPDQVKTLIAVREVPVRDALAQLSAADLKRLGVKVVDTDDQPFIRPADSDTDKLVRSLIDQHLEGQ